MLYLVGTGAQHSRPGQMVGESGPEPSIKDRAGPLEPSGIYLSSSIFSMTISMPHMASYFLPI